MERISKKKLIVLSVAFILACICLLIGATFALFTESNTSSHHLYSGTLDIGLTRTNLKYKTINDLGYLVENTVTDDIDLTKTTHAYENAFGLNSQSVKIIPGSYFEADLEITNDGNTAFVYYITMSYKGIENELSKQLNVTITHADGSTTVKTLNEFSGGIRLEAGEMSAKDLAESFKIRIDFTEDTIFNGTNPPPTENMDNDLAQTSAVNFDISVYAEQASR